MYNENVPKSASQENNFSEKDDHKDDHSDARMSATNLRAIHDKSCKIVEMMDKMDMDEKLSKSWVQSKLTLADDYLTAIHDYIVFDKEAADSDEHGGDKMSGGDMGGGFIISVEKKLG